MKNDIKIALKKAIYGLYRVLFHLLSLLPKNNKVVITTMRGRKYSDNPRYIAEELHRQDPSLDIVWFVDNRYKYETPRWLRIVPYYKGFMLKRIFEMATAKVWVNSHLFETFVVKSNKQLFVQTWHATMALKKVYYDIFKQGHCDAELDNTTNITDVILSNSDFNDELYRRAFKYEGPIYRCGFPRSDELVQPKQEVRELVRERLGVQGKNIFLYAPTFRDEFERSRYTIINYEVYDVDFERLHKALVEKFGGEWVIAVKFHPIMQNYIKDSYYNHDHVINATSYSNMQEITCAADLVLTDYSSSIMDAAIAGVPGLTLCIDHDAYMEERDVYFNMKELPFPYADNNDQLINNIKDFDKEDYFNKWNAFAKELDLLEPGNASQNIAAKIIDFIKNGTVNWN